MNRKILILSGGTGGHVIPAKNFGNFLDKKGNKIFLLLDKRGQKYSENFNGKIYVINSSHFTGNIFFKIKALLNLIIGFFQSFYIVFKIKPEVCISFGSYATSMPFLVILFYKFFFKIKIYMHEQNTIIGKVNLFFLPYVINIFTNFESVINLESKYLEKKLYVGFPSKLINEQYIYDKKDKKTIFIYGGSQGSIEIINTFLSILKKIDNKYLKNLKLIIQSPSSIVDNVNNSLKLLKVDYEIKVFYNNIEEILGKTSIAITRGGSGTINDLIKYKVPSIIIPLPNSIKNHQYYNAKYLYDRNCTILINNNEFETIDSLNIIKNLILSNNKLIEMRESLKKINVPNANQIMLDEILK